MQGCCGNEVSVKAKKQEGLLNILKRILLFIFKKGNETMRDGSSRDLEL